MAPSIVLARTLSRYGIHYGWVMVALVFAFAVCSSATVSIPGVLIPIMSKDLGWSIGELSGPLGLRVALFGLVAPFAGGLMMRYGTRAVVIMAAALLIGGLALSMIMNAKWQLWLGLGIVLGVASGLTSLVLATNIATAWFLERRGLVIGILSAGTATGQLIFLPAVAWIAEMHGWRVALLPSALAIATLALAFVMLARDRPADLGLPPFGASELQPDLPPASGNPFALSFQALGIAARSPVIWVLAFTFFICGVSSFGVTPHFVALCSDNGISAMTSTSLLALIGVCDLIGTIGSGWLTDRYNSRWLLAWYYGLRGLSLIWLPYSGFSLVGLSAFAIFYGLDFIATIPPTVRLTVKEVGAAQAPLVFGWIFAAHHLGAGLTAFLAGETRDALGTYLPALLVAGALCLVATGSMLLLRGRPPIVVAAE
jgi:predicted MFS family arabinose efflux permease